MSQNPLNLAVRFLLEIAALIAMGYWGWTQHAGALRFALGLGGPLLAAVLWAILRVPNEPGAPGHATVPVPGWLRLLLELALFTFAAWGLFASGATTAGTIFAIVALLHYAVSYDRVWWLIKY